MRTLPLAASLALSLSVLASSSSCAAEKDSSAPQGPAPAAPAPAAPAPAAPAPAPAGPPAVAGPIGDVLTRYEAMRARLAADDTSTLLAEAEKVRDAAKQAQAAADVGAKAPALAEIVAAADKVAGMRGADIETLRIAWGDVSKGVVALLVAEPSLRAGRFLCECPMARGYKRWVQTSEKLANPYMGTKMLECGSLEQTWKV